METQFNSIQFNSMILSHDKCIKGKKGKKKEKKKKKEK